jgi:hypothetical protein
VEGHIDDQLCFQINIFSLLHSATLVFSWLSTIDSIVDRLRIYLVHCCISCSDLEHVAAICHTQTRHKCRN